MGREAEGFCKLRVLRLHGNPHRGARGAGADVQFIAPAVYADAVIKFRPQFQHQLRERAHEFGPVPAGALGTGPLLRRVLCRGLVWQDELLSRRDAQLPVQRVGAAAVIGLGCADVAPVTLQHRAVQPLALPQQQGKQIPAEVERPLRHRRHRPGRERVDAGVHQVAHHPGPGRFFDKGPDVPRPVRHRQAVAQRLRTAAESNRRGGAACPVLLHQAGE